MPITHWAAPEVRRVAERLIVEHHRHLQGVRMEYLFQSEASRRNGRITFGTAQKVTGWKALLSTPDVADDPEGTSEGLEYFLITIAHDMWLLMPPKARTALVDHELSHCYVEMSDDDVLLSMRSHEIEEFSGVLKRHGLWRVDLIDFVRRVGPEEVSIWQDLPPDLEMGDEEEIPFDQLQVNPGTEVWTPSKFDQVPPGVSSDGEVLREAAAEGPEVEPPFA